ncbi:IclR family transcriptional regulator domain-containing protein [Mesorhizobium escarrei]|nr:helix-turn-helix domain-containing protein [Mesorhizobium escarrei]
MPAFDPVTAVLRALEVLRLVNQLDHASVAEIHRQTGIPKATVLRMVETLINAGYVAREDGAATYTATGKCLLLSNGLQVHARMTAKAAPILNVFRRKVGWPSDFGIFDGDAMVIAATNREFGTLSLNRKPGARAPMLLSALGRAYLAFCPADEQERILQALRLSKNPLDELAKDRAGTTKLLKQTRARGYSVSDREYLDTIYEGAIWGIGVPVMAAGQVVASLNVMFLRKAMSMDSGIKTLLRPLQQVAEQVGTDLDEEALGLSRGT